MFTIKDNSFSLDNQRFSLLFLSLFKYINIVFNYKITEQESDKVVPNVGGLTFVVLTSHTSYLWTSYLLTDSYDDLLRVTNPKSNQNVNFFVSTNNNNILRRTRKVRVERP